MSSRRTEKQRAAREAFQELSEERLGEAAGRLGVPPQPDYRAAAAIRRSVDRTRRALKIPLSSDPQGGPGKRGDVASRRGAEKALDLPPG